MRQTLIAGNWKMNLNRQEAVDLASGLVSKMNDSVTAEVVVCPPSVYLEAVGFCLKGSPVALGAQNVYHEQNGAFTGELSTAMLQDLGCKYVILGHSERRHILGETDADVNKKVKTALAAGLVPIVCVGEKLDEHEAGHTQQVVSGQIEQSLAGFSAEQVAQMVIAYEPVWAIGTGKVATPEQAEEVHCDLRNLLESRYNAEVASSVQVLYGGSVKPDNAAELLAQPNIDGALVGGAALSIDNFFGIIEAAG